MFKPNFDICVKCNFPGMIVVKAGYCQRCNHEVKKEKKTERLASQGEQTQQELDELFYRAAWASKPHECEECGQKLKAFNAILFLRALMILSETICETLTFSVTIIISNGNSGPEHS